MQCEKGKMREKRGRKCCTALLSFRLYYEKLDSLTSIIFLCLIQKKRRKKKPVSFTATLCTGTVNVSPFSVLICITFYKRISPLQFFFSFHRGACFCSHCFLFFLPKMFYKHCVTTQKRVLFYAYKNAVKKKKGSHVIYAIYTLM